MEIKFKLGKERDEKIQRKADLENARMIYEQWKKEFIGTRKTTAELPAATAILAERLEQVVKTPSIRDNLVRWVEQKVMNLHRQNIVRENTVELYADCPHAVIIGTQKGICGWGGLVRVPHVEWFAKTLSIKCPQCGQVLGIDDFAEKQAIDKIAETERREEDDSD